MSSDAPIECRGLSCGYLGRPVLTGVNLAFQAGTISALLGPNGSGKSTLLKTMIKILPPQAGQVLIDGKSVADLHYRELAKRLAFVPQEEQTAFGFTVRQVVVMGRLPLSGGLLDTHADHAAAEEAMEAADCLALENRVVTELSGGEKQRVLIARALAQGAKILLMDEPTSHLDVGHQVAIASLMRELSRQGYTIVVAMHDLNLAAAVADQGLLLADGKVGLQKPMPELLAHPLTDAVYGVAFRRLQSTEGHPYIFPQM
jgi:iron complex transport system ATP-binding protein